MRSLEVSGAVRPIYGSLGFKRLRRNSKTSADMNLSLFNLYLLKFQMPGKKKNRVKKERAVLTI